MRPDAITQRPVPNGGAAEPQMVMVSLPTARGMSEPSRSWRKVAWLMGAVCGLAVWLLSMQDTWADVGADGSFTMSVPITVPAFHGIQPGLSLSYSSHGGAGWVGVGWSVQGLSVISRRSAGRGLPLWDGTEIFGLPLGDGTDIFTLDGQPLMPCAGGTATVAASPSCARAVGGMTAFTAEIETYQRIAFIPDFSGGRWRVWHGDGTVADYAPGTVTDRGVFDWRVDTVTNASGNMVTFHWVVSTAGAAPTLQSVSYGDVVIAFVSEDRPDPIVTATGDGTVTQKSRLTSITETAAGLPLRSYVLHYRVDQDRSRESVLSSVQPFGSDGTTSLPASTYDTLPGSAAGSWAQGGQLPLPGVDGMSPSGPDDTSLYNKNLTGGTAGPDLMTWPASSKDFNDWLTVDADSNGTADLVRVTTVTTPPQKNGPPEHTKWFIQTKLSQPNAGHAYLGAYFDPPLPAEVNVKSAMNTAGIVTADVNGDGLQDLVFMIDAYIGTGTPTRVVAVAFGSGGGLFGTGTPLSGPVYYDSTLDRGNFTGFRVADVTGDGKADLITMFVGGDCPSGGVRTRVGDGAGGFTPQAAACWPPLGPSNVQGVSFQTEDVNGDHIPDLVGFQVAGDPQSPSPSPTARILTAVSRGDGTFVPTIFDTGQVWQRHDPEPVGKVCGPLQVPIHGDCSESHNVLHFFGDFDGDGGTDLVVVQDSAPGPEGLVLLGRGDGTYSNPAAWNGVPTNELVSYVVGDANGNTYSQAYPNTLLAGDYNADGLPDFAVLATDPLTGRVCGGLTKILNNGRGGFDTQPAATHDWSSGSTTAGAPDTVILGGDLNGDGADEVIALTGQQTGDAVKLNTEMGRAAPWAAPMLDADTNADGIPDLVMPIPAVDPAADTAGHPAVRLRIIPRKADGTLLYRGSLIGPLSLPTGAPQYLPTSGWITADVNGDHLTDLINLPPNATTGVELINGGDSGWHLNPITLKSLDRTITGDPPDCEPPRRFCPRPRDTTDPARFPITGSWSAADENSDGITDLVHIGPGASYQNSLPSSTPGTLILTGSLTGVLTPAFAELPPDVTQQTDLAGGRGWRSVDVDGDSQGDLVHIDTATATVWSLRRRINGGGWQAVSAHLDIATSPPATPSTALWDPGSGDSDWSPAAVNADQAADLTRVHVDPGTGRGYVETLLGNGDGNWSSRTYPLPADALAEGGMTGADNQNWIPADVAATGRSDLTKVVDLAGELKIYTLLSDGDGNWTPTTWLAPARTDLAGRWRLSTVAATPTAWRITTKPDGRHTVSSYRSQALADTVTSVDNGLGATTTLDYRTVSAQISRLSAQPVGCRLPEGAGSGAVVTSVTTRVQPGSPAPVLSGTVNFPDRQSMFSQLAAAAPTAGATVTDSSDMSYDCARYSTELHSILGFTDSRTTHPGSATRADPRLEFSVHHVKRSIADVGIIQTTLDETRTAGGGLLHQSTSTYAPLTSAPYVDRITTTSTGDCDAPWEFNTYCAASTSQFVNYDSVGNVIDQIDTAAGSNRRRETTRRYIYLRQDTRWFEHLPQYIATWDPDTPGSLRWTTDCYDGDTSMGCDRFGPDFRGLLTQTLAVDGSQNKFTGGAEYDNWGNKTVSYDGAHNPTVTTFDPLLHLYPIKVCNALNQCTTSPTPWDRRADKPLAVTDPNNATTLASFDALGRPATTISPTGGLTTTSYSTGPTGTITTALVTSPGVNMQTRTFTNGLGHTTRTEAPGGDGTRTTVTDTTYLTGTLPLTTTRPHFSDEPATAFDTVSFYDGLGRAVTITHADGSTTTTGRSVDPTTRLTVTTTKDENGHATIDSTDGWGALMRVDQPSVENPGATATTTYGYTAFGELRTVTDAHQQQILTNTYNKLGQKTSEDDADRGTTTSTYDPAGNLATSTDARNNTLSYTYDPLNREKTKTDVTADTVVTFTYDEPGHGQAPTGRLTTVTDPVSAADCAANASRQISYDIAGDPTLDLRCVKGLPASTNTQYDALGRPTVMSYPDALPLRYTYDQAGHLASLKGYVDDFQYDASGNTIGATYANHTRATWTYDPSRSWLDSQTLTPVLDPTATTPLFNDTYTRDPAGQVTRQHSTSNNQDETYTYDPVNELSTVTNTANNETTQSFTYDDIGNVTNNSTTGTYTYEPTRTCSTPTTCTGPHATASAGTSSYTYDATGNTTTITAAGKPTRQMTWDSSGHLSDIQDTAADQITNTYDPAGTRVQQQDHVGTTTYYGAIAGHTAAGWTDYIYAGGTLIAQHSPITTTWYAQDRQGSTRSATDTAGDRIQASNYTPTGQQQTITGSANTIGYGGHRTLGGTDLIDMAARDYDPTLGRMLSADSIIPNTALPIALNRYSYAYNNPTTYTDPSGHDPAADQAAGDNYFAQHPGGNGFGDIGLPPPPPPPPPPGTDGGSAATGGGGDAATIYIAFVGDTLAIEPVVATGLGVATRSNPTGWLLGLLALQGDQGPGAGKNVTLRPPNTAGQAAVADAGVADAGVSDAGVSDAGVPDIVQNKANGAAWESGLVDPYKSAGFGVVLHPGAVRTPDGLRYPDIAIYHGLILIEYIEAKASPTARYPTSQRKKDEFIERRDGGTPTSVVRRAPDGGIY